MPGQSSMKNPCIIWADYPIATYAEYAQVRYSAGDYNTAASWMAVCAAFPGLADHPKVWEAAKPLYDIRLKFAEVTCEAVYGGGICRLHSINQAKEDLDTALADRNQIFGGQVSSEEFLRNLMIAGAFLVSNKHSYDCQKDSLEEAFGATFCSSSGRAKKVDGRYPIAKRIAEIYADIHCETRDNISYRSHEDHLISAIELKKCLLETAVCAFYEVSGLRALGVHLRSTPAELAGRDYHSLHQILNDHPTFRYDAPISLEQHQSASALRAQLTAFGERVAARMGGECPVHLPIDALIGCILDENFSGVINAAADFIPGDGPAPYQERIIELLRKFLDHRIAVAQAKYDEACGKEDSRLRCAILEYSRVSEQAQMAFQEFCTRIANAGLPDAHFHRIPDWMVFTAIEKKRAIVEKNRIADEKSRNYKERNCRENAENDRWKMRLDECDVSGMIYWEIHPREYSCWPPSEEERIRVGDGSRYYAVLSSKPHPRSENEFYQDGHDLTCVDAAGEIKIVHIRCIARYFEDRSKGPGFYSQGCGIVSGVIEAAPGDHSELFALQAEMMPAYSGPILEARAAAKAAEEAEEAAKMAVREAAIEERKPFYHLLHILKLIHEVNEKFPRYILGDAEMFYQRYTAHTAGNDADLAKYVAEARLRGDRECDVEWKRIVKECVERAREIGEAAAEGINFGEGYSRNFSIPENIAKKSSDAVDNYFKPLGVSASPENVAYAMNLARKTAQEQVELWLDANEVYVALVNWFAADYPYLGETTSKYIAADTRHAMVTKYNGDMEQVNEHANHLIRRFVKKWQAFNDAYHRAHNIDHLVNGQVYHISHEVSVQIAEEVSSIYYNSIRPDGETTQTLAEGVLIARITAALEDAIAEAQEIAEQLQAAQQLGHEDDEDDTFGRSAPAA